MRYSNRDEKQIEKLRRSLIYFFSSSAAHLEISPFVSANPKIFWNVALLLGIRFNSPKDGRDRGHNKLKLRGSFAVSPVVVSSRLVSAPCRSMLDQLPLTHQARCISSQSGCSRLRRLTISIVHSLRIVFRTKIFTANGNWGSRRVSVRRNLFKAIGALK